MAGEKKLLNSLIADTTANLENNVNKQIEDTSKEVNDAATLQEQTNLNNAMLGKAEPKVTDPVEDAIKKSNETNAKAYSQLVKSYEDQLKANQTAQQTENRNNSRAQLFGGIAEAASALVNLGGTIGGASPMKWDSPQPAWAQRVDTITKERDAKLNTLKGQLNELRLKKAALDSNNAQMLASYKARKDQIALGYDGLDLSRDNLTERISKRLQDLNIKEEQLDMNTYKQILIEAEKIVAEERANANAVGKTIDVNSCLTRAINNVMAGRKSILERLQSGEKK